MAIKIPFVAEVAEFLRGTRSVEDSLEDVADALDDISTAGDDVNREVGKDLDTVADTADDSADRIRRSFKDAFDSVEKQGRTSTRKVKDDVDDVGRRGSSTLREFSSEAKQNVAESVSSFTGSASSAVDAVQSTFGGLVTALGPAGVVGAAVVGVGIGLARGLFERSKEEAEALRERVGELFEEMRANQGAITETFKSDALADLIDDAERLERIWGTSNIGEIRDTMHDLGLTTGETERIWAGFVGGQEDAAAALDLVNQRQQDLKRQLQDPTIPMSRQGELREQAEVLADLETALGGAGDAADSAAAKTDLFNLATKDQADATDAAAGSLKDQNEQLRENARLKGDAVESEWDMRDAIDAVSKARKDNGKTLDTNTAKGRDNARAVKNAIDAINEFGDAQIDAGKDTDATNEKLKAQEDALVRQVARAFGITDEKARTYIRTLGGIPRKKETDVDVDDKGTAKATSDRIDTASRDRDSRVSVSADLSGVDRQIKSYFAGRTYDFKVYARPGQAVGV